MTREEAIEILQGAIKKPNTKDGYLGQAIDMSIKALEQEPCEDCISRQATYQKMLELQGKKRDRYLDIDDVRVVLQGMPSVQPKRDKGDKE